MIPNRYNLEIVLFEKYDFETFKRALEDYIFTNSKIESKQLVEELKLKDVKSNATIAQVKSFDYINDNLVIRFLYDIGKININKYKVKIEGKGMTINGLIYLDKITKMILEK